MHPYKNMRVKGTAKKRTIHILIDSGTTHNFLDLSLAKGLGCKLNEIDPVDITVAHGNHIFCAYKCQTFS